MGGNGQTRRESARILYDRLLTLHLNADSAPFNRENRCHRPGKLDLVWTQKLTVANPPVARFPESEDHPADCRNEATL
jgi:hypothetical protein